MADTVRHLMEEMIPELEELEGKGYFSRAEVKAVAQKRQDFEYALKRRAALKRDFLRYIDYECKLEELRRHRKKARGIKGKKGLAELGIARRVHFIYERATRKFKADLSLWMDWLAYCKRSKSNKQFSKVVTKALHRHSHVAALWIEAAAWEFEHTSNVASARSLMQRGLRHCPKDEVLWAEYCRLELMYVARLRARRHVLGLPNPETAEDFQAPATKVKRKRTQPTPAATTTQDQDDDAAAVPETDPETDASEAAVRGVLTGAVVRAVIKGAVIACPLNLGLRVRLLRVLRQFDFPGVSALQDFVYEGVEADFTADEAAWDVLARRHWPAGHDKQDAPHVPPPAIPASAAAAAGAATAETDMETDVDPDVDMAAHDQCCGVYEQGVRALPTCRMHAIYTRYLGQRALPLLARAAAGDAAAIGALATVGAQLLAAYQAALKATGAAKAGGDGTGERLCAEWVDWALALGQPRVAVKAAVAACGAFPASCAVWLRRGRLELELLQRGQRQPAQLLEALQAGLEAVAPAEAAPLWQAALAAVPPGHADHSRLRRLLLSRLAGRARGPLSGGMGAVVGSLLRETQRLQGLQPFRALVDQLLLLPPAGGDWFHAALDVELEHLQQSGQGGAVAGAASAAEVWAAEAAVRRLFEAAVGAYGSEDVKLWLRYAAHGQERLKGAGDVYWRATKALEEPDLFVEQFRQMMAAQ